ncbi:ABC transporter ATP-binding protein [Ideonella sp. DXS22W]|uniref:ABC transporter ATP-binding protein n=1 Tax=Pseudaquabacterium inlustre TaxID=2984192 RepID=A0ABU9CDX0_9BURK
MAEIRIRNLQKTFGSTQVLKGVGLDVGDGEFISLVGPSGCGKSTLLRILAGLERQDGGEVHLAGRRMDALPPAARDIAMVFQSYALYPHLSVRENIGVPLAVRRLSRWQRLPVLGRWWPGSRACRAEIDREVQAAAQQLDIAHLLDRKPGQLSGGQRQRTALGRALVRRPAAFLMDEPLSNLDANLRVQMRSEITALHRQLGTTFVYVTHDQTEAMTMSTRVAVMMGGRLLQVGSPSQVYFDPANLQVAEFIGQPRLNTLVCERDGQGRIRHHGQPLPVALPGAGPAGQRITLGLRPEALALEAVGRLGLTGQVTGHEHLGSDVLVWVALDGSGQRLVLRCDALAALPERGQTVGVRIEPARALAFDTDGRRLALEAATHG